MIERLNAHREWANRRITEWCYALPEPEHEHDDESRNYCIKMISHILLGERAWLSRLKGEPVRHVWELLDAAEAATLLESNEADWKNILASDLNRMLHYKRFTGEVGDSSISDIVIHVCTHGMYHRGQIAARAAQLGLKIPSTDFIVYTRLMD